MRHPAASRCVFTSGTCKRPAGHTHTHKIETTIIIQHNCGHTGSPWHKCVTQRQLYVQSNYNSPYVILWQTSCSPVTSLLQKGQSLDFLCLLHSLLQSFPQCFHFFTSGPVQWDIPSGKPPHIQSQLSNKHLPSERSVKFQLLTETELWHPQKIFNQNCIDNCIL